MKQTIKSGVWWSLFLVLFDVEIVWARAGGGGSGGGGGGGGGSFSSHSYGSSTAGGSSNIGLVSLIFIVAVIWIIGRVIRRSLKSKKQNEIAKQVISAAATQDVAWQEDVLLARAKEVFYQFQKAWSENNVAVMQTLLTPEYFKRMVLELNVLKNQGRRNIMESVSLISLKVNAAQDSADNNQDKFTVELTASAKDKLLDVIKDEVLYVDSSLFIEYWTFKRINDIWYLDIIKQSTENVVLTESAIAEFARQNNFYYDPDFGWLMMPDKGVLFNKTNFKVSDINNHVIGYYRDKIVEFYTYIPNANSKISTNYLVAQAILPINYENILIKKKQFINWPHFGLRYIELESVEFNNKFRVWAGKKDQVNSLELLTPNFMEKIYNLPFELNIEIVGNTLYLYTKERGSVNYPRMLEVLSWAFDEMKM